MNENRRHYYFTAEGLSVGYDGKPLIRDIDISLERGKILTLIGPNGGGKSTILRSIAGQLQKIGGTVFLDGRNTESIGRKQLAREMSVVLTERVRPELMTCADMAAAGRYPYTGRLGILSEEDRLRVRRALKIVKMESYADADFRTVSDGQQQRVLLARVICQEPELILLDEPTSYLDIKHKLAMLQILRRLVREQAVTVILSLHELELAQKVSDYVLCVKGEYADRYGTPEEIFKEEYIRRLYDLDNGYYSEIFGSVEIKRDAGKWGERSPAADVSAANDAGKPGTPEVFVIAGGGSGASVFRQLQREGIPFAAGVLHRNDIDYELARMLADCVVPERAYERIGEEAYAQALRIMRDCGRVICCLKDEEFGEMNDGNRRLLREAEKAGLNVERRT